MKFAKGYTQKVTISVTLCVWIVCWEFRRTTQHGAIEGKTQKTTLKHYNLEVIISVGYRVKSQLGAQFRIWATQRLNEYIIKGIALNDDRFKSGGSMRYFNELQGRLREISLSERFFYQKIKDIYTTSIDYDSKNERIIILFKEVQNKLLWAISEQTAGEFRLKLELVPFWNILPKMANQSRSCFSSS